MRNEKNAGRLAALWIFLGFLAWIFAFRGFLTSSFALTSDALSYYDHTKFFIENIGSGVYPLWDPFWYHGAPNDFFLRRIGALNPLYLAILLLKSLSVPYTLAYLWFLAAYYWGGMVAFYLLAMRLYHERLMAYAGYLILLFSALGTRLFDSYMMLVTVPLIWFFYFLTAFTQTPRKHFFLGMVLSFMVLGSTYIPFYFLIILGFFLFFYGLIYFDRIPGILRRYAAFFKDNKMLTVCSLAVLVLSFFPIIAFFHDSTRGHVVFPMRHGEEGAAHVLTVPHKALDWGAAEDLMASAFFSNLRLYKFAIVYVPFFSVVVFFLGLAGRLSRRAVFMFLLGVGLFCSILPYGLPFYDFFYKHVFFLKYFRNLHFFIWFFLIPLFVLLVLEHWKIFREMVSADPRRRGALLAYVAALHLVVLVFVWWRNDAVSSTYVMIFLSLVFWVLMVLGQLRANAWGFALLAMAVLVQPLQTYYYFCLKASPYSGSYGYDFSYRSLQLKDPDLLKPENISAVKGELYYATSGYNFIYQNTGNYALARYLQNKFILVDHLEVVGPKTVVSVLDHDFLTNADMAVIFKHPAGTGWKLNGNDPHPPAEAQGLDTGSEGFKVLGFDANHLRLTVDVPYEKFFIYNDSYDPYWRASVNHVPAPLYEVNGPFKGIWIPAGRSVIEFSYGCWWQYAMNIFLSVFAVIFLIGIVFYARFP